MELYLLEYLVAFRDCGTVEAAAAQLSVTAPTVSRGLRKLESLLGVSLLDRTPAKMRLNATGVFAADQAESLLARVRDFGDSVREFEHDHGALRIASAAPGVLQHLEGYPHAVVSCERYVTDSAASALLHDCRIDLAITTSEHDEDGLESVFLGRDSLIAKLTDVNELYDRPSLSFADLAGQEFVLPRDIGVWRDVLERYAKGVMLIYQANQAAFCELVRYSNFPIFRTTLTQGEPDAGFRPRRGIPITDATATIELYATYRVEDRERLFDAVRFISDALAKAQGQADGDC